jgi:hypothetical protein
MIKNKIWVITQAQIEAGDVERAVMPVDPDQFTESELFQLHGAVRLRFDGAKGIADIIANQAARKFCRQLHVRWPWAGFFLRLKPISAESSVEEILDVSVFMSLIFTHVDRLAFVETPSGVGLRCDAEQLRRHLAELSKRAADLAEVVDIAPIRISKRDALISQTVVSFFRGGETSRNGRR